MLWCFEAWHCAVCVGSVLHYWAGGADPEGRGVKETMGGGLQRAQEWRRKREIARTRERERERERGILPNSNFLQCCAWLSVKGGWEAKGERDRERERDSISLSATGDSTARAPPPPLLSAFLRPSFPFSICLRSCPSSLPCSVWAGVRLDFPPGEHSDGGRR